MHANGVPRPLAPREAPRARCSASHSTLRRSPHSCSSCSVRGTYGGGDVVASVWAQEQLPAVSGHRWCRSRYHGVFASPLRSGYVCCASCPDVRF